MKKDIENKAYNFIEKHEKEIEEITRNTIINNDKKQEDTIKFVLNNVPIEISDKGIYVKGRYTNNLYEISDFEMLENIFCKEEQTQTKEDILCERIRNTTSNWLENAIKNKNVYEVQVETLGLVIDELVDYIGSEKVANTVFDRTNNLSL